MAAIIYAPGLGCCQTKSSQVLLQCLACLLLNIGERGCLGLDHPGSSELLLKVRRQLLPGSNRMSPEFVEPTLGKAGQSGWKQHASELGVKVGSPHYHVENAEMAPRVGSAIV